MRQLDAEAILAGLDEEQTVAVLARQGPVRILAGAGTGKTRTITHRIAYHAATGSAPAKTVLAVTHSAKAATEMRERLAALGVPAVQARTFHSAALRQLRYFWAATHRPGTGPALVDTVRGGRYGMIRGALAAAQGIRPAAVASTDVLDADSEITWAHARRVPPAQYVAAAAAAHRVPGLPLPVLAEAYRRYEKDKLTLNVLDFDDVLSTMAALLEDDADVAEAVRGQYRSFVVDEYQDTDPAQQRLLDAWLGPRDAVAVVGDPFQAIYGFRGADTELIRRFDTRYPHAVSVALVRDYRSTPQVVAAANRLVARAPGGSGLVLHGQQPTGPEPVVRTYPTDTAETDGLADRVRDLLAAGTPAGQIAVLHRFNAQAPALRQALVDAGIPVSVQADEKFYARPEIVDIARRLTAADPDGSALGALDEALDGSGFDPSEPPPGFGAARERWESRNALREMAHSLPGVGEWPVAQLLAELSRRADAEHVPATAQAVSVLTIHKAKGLEWDVVLLPRLTDGSLPSSLATTDDELAEERRLAYVAVTRARRVLEVSHAQTWGEQQRRAKPSPYLTEIRPPRPAAGHANGSTSPTRAGGHGKSGKASKGSARAVPAYTAGDRLTHDKHGLGRVAKVTGAGAEQVLTVNFSDGKSRKVTPARDPVQKL